MYKRQVHGLQPAHAKAQGTFGLDGFDGFQPAAEGLGHVAAAQKGKACNAAELEMCIRDMYYANSVNGLPEGVFAAVKGFDSGWMDLTGQWLYAESIFCLLYTSPLSGK